MKADVEKLFDDYPQKSYTPSDLGIAQLAMKLKEKPTDEEKNKFRVKCELIEKELGASAYITEPLILKRIQNRGYILTYPFKSDLSLKDLNQKFGNNIYMEGMVPDKNWVND